MDTTNKKEVDNVNHPPHYCNHRSGVECITVAGEMSFTLGNAFKYLYRCNDKGRPLQDLQKAAFYLEYEFERRRKLWFKFEPLHYETAEHGDENIKAILRAEFRYSGQVKQALGLIYKANKCRRSIRSVELALFTVWGILRDNEEILKRTEENGTP